MHPIRLEIDFNDEIYKRTGIKPHSLALKEREFELNGKAYLCQIIKKNTGVKETIYVSLKDSSGNHIEDIQVKTGDKIMKFDQAKSQDSVVIEDVEENDLHSMELSSESEGVSAVIDIKLERPEDLCIKKSLNIQLTSEGIYKELKSFMAGIGKEAGTVEKGDDCIDETEMVKLAEPGKAETVAPHFVEHLLRPCFYCAKKFINFYESFMEQSGKATTTEDSKKEAKKRKTKD